MSCTSCSTGKPGGCKSNGGCSTGGCNRMNVHDWLANLPFSDPESSCRIIEVSFNQGSRKDFYRNNALQYFEKGDIIAVEGVSGFDVGTVSITGELVRLQLKKHGLKEDNADFKKILRFATDNDIIKWKETKSREHDVLIRSRAMARQLNVNLKMAKVEIQADSRKASFFYIADERVDFRELIKIYASEFKVKVEMRQIGARQEAGKVGGIGSCGRELCCSTWLTDFKSVNTNAARYQNLSINQTKLSGQCGRLKCCLNYELDTYLDALQHFPEDAEVIEVTKGRAFLIKKDIFRNLMWYSMPDSTKHYPLSIESVKKIQAQNRNGIKPDTLETVEVISGKIKEVEPEFVDVVGHITIKSLEKNTRKHRNDSNRRENKPGGQQQQQRPQNTNQKRSRNNNNRNRPPKKD
ncbi:MAG TPA: regulatory iron-sulfur-containing complex subunit RicT [Chitinophagaceae bacterium]|nr:regulatory iron-sulfur-containing complex subunit RicT [Chitinophagaceae bacterium]